MLTQKEVDGMRVKYISLIKMGSCCGTFFRIHSSYYSYPTDTIRQMVRGNGYYGKKYGKLVPSVDNRRRITRI